MTLEEYKNAKSHINFVEHVVPEGCAGYQQSPVDLIEKLLFILKINNIDIEQSSFMDMGCGYGILLQFCKELGFKQVKGIEYNAKMKKYTKKQFPDISNDITYGNALRYFKRRETVLYTFNIVWDEAKKIDWFSKILNNLKEHQILIESYDHNDCLVRACRELNSKRSFQEPHYAYTRLSSTTFVRLYNPTANRI